MITRKIPTSWCFSPEVMKQVEKTKEELKLPSNQATAEFLINLGLKSLKM
jgi:hypothetical protein